MALTLQRRTFAREYLVDFNGTNAAIRAGIKPGNAPTQAFRWLTDADVLEFIEDLQNEKLEVAELSIEWVLRQWKRIAEADPNDLSWTEVDCCRYCYGVDHKYQWIEVQFRQAFDSALAHECSDRCAKKGCSNRMPDGAGGMGYDPRLRPVQDCPVCAGRGTEIVRVADSRSLKGSARRLYAGVKQTKDGIEIKMRDQDAALQCISKYFGMTLERKEITTAGGKPITLVNLDVRDLTDAQLIQVMQMQLTAESDNTIEGVID